MLTVESAPDHVIAVRFTDVLEKADVEAFKKIVDEKLQDNTRLNLLLDMSQWSDVSAEAMLNKTWLDLASLEKLRRFGRIAFVSDKQFVWTLAGTMNALVGTTESMSYAAANHAQGLTFVSELPPPAPQPQHKLERIETADPGVLAFRVMGIVDADDVKPLLQALGAAMEREGRIDMLVDVTGYEGFDPALLATPGLAAMKLEAIRRVRRYAIVGANSWMRQLAGFVAKFLPVEIRHFDAGKQSDALRWLQS